MIKIKKYLEDYAKLRKHHFEGYVDFIKEWINLIQLNG